MSVLPEAEPWGLEGPPLVLRYAGKSVTLSDTTRRGGMHGHLCPAGNRLPADRLVITAGFPAQFDLDVAVASELVAAEILVAGGTVTRLAPEVTRTTSVQDGQTVEIIRQPLQGVGGTTETMRFSVIPLTGTRIGGPETVQITARVLDENGGAAGLATVTAGSETRLCGPAY